MSDTTTTLSPGVGGDVMDESLVTQSDNVTQAKRPRVVIAGDASGKAIIDPVKADPGANPYTLPTVMMVLVKDAPEGGYVADELRAMTMTTDGRLRVSSVNVDNYINMFGDTSPIETSFPTLLTSPPNPWE